MSEKLEIKSEQKKEDKVETAKHSKNIETDPKIKKNKSQHSPLLFAGILIATTLAVAGAYFSFQALNGTSSEAAGAKEQELNIPEKTFSLEKIEKNDGKSKNKCYVSLDGLVYELEKSRQWKIGTSEVGWHVASRGRFNCGQDLGVMKVAYPDEIEHIKNSKILGKLDEKSLEITKKTSKTEFSREELSQNYNGEGENPCFVVLENEVFGADTIKVLSYSSTGGEHLPSNIKDFCGGDLDLGGREVQPAKDRLEKMGNIVE
jgi:predicted heme/steroid binding protein